MSGVDRAAAVAGLLLELGALRDLRSWEPVGSLLEELGGMLRGTGGLSPAELARARRWAWCWSRVAAPVRAFYAAELDRTAANPSELHGLVETALWRILEGEARPDLSPKQKGRLRALWLDHAGSEPSYDLCPISRYVPDRG